MENIKKYQNLLLFICFVVLGLGCVLTGFLLDLHLKQTFIPTEDVGKYVSQYYIYMLEIGGALVFLLSFGYLYSFLQEKFNLKKMNVRQMTVIGVFSALSIVLYYFAKFKIDVMFPTWLDIQFSDVPALIVTYMYGPLSGALVIIVRFFCKLPGTQTVGVGELADLLIGLALVLVAGLFYKKHRTFKGALLATTFGMLAGTLVGVVSNWLILIPAYKGIAGFSQAALTGTMDTLISGGNGVVTDENFMVYYLFVSVLPFNLFRYVLVFIITFILYKRLSILINSVAGEFNEVEQKPTEIDVTSPETVK